MSMEEQLEQLTHAVGDLTEVLRNHISGESTPIPAEMAEALEKKAEADLKATAVKAKNAAKKAAAKKAAAKKGEAEVDVEDVTLESLRALTRPLIAAGLTDELKEVLGTFDGAGSVPTLDEEHYDAFNKVLLEMTAEHIES